MPTDINKKLKLKIINIFGTQWEFAAAVGVGEDKVSRAVRRREYPKSIKTREKWADALNCKQEEIFI